MPERFTEVMFLVASLRQKNEVLKELSVQGFAVRELIGLIQ
jgi:hypothetical protein